MFLPDLNESVCILVSASGPLCWLQREKDSEQTSFGQINLSVLLVQDIIRKFGK